MESFELELRQLLDEEPSSFFSAARHINRKSEISNVIAPAAEPQNLLALNTLIAASSNSIIDEGKIFDLIIS